MTVPDQVIAKLKNIPFGTYVEFGGHQYRWIESKDARNDDGKYGGVLEETPPRAVIEEVDSSADGYNWIINHWAKERLLQDVLNEIRLI